jgi:hypothetical protein
MASHDGSLKAKKALIWHASTVREDVQNAPHCL